MASDEFVAPPARGRRFESRVRVRITDVNVAGRLRLDAIARILQDVSSDDTVDAGQPSDAAWVVRRIVLELAARTPRLRDEISLVTWCSGTGPRWAERSTDLALAGDVVVRARALWVFVDIASGRPIPLPPDFEAAYAEAAAGRRVGQRLQHAGPPADATATPWPLRATDIDLLGHVNNAAYWAPVEEVLASLAPGRRLAHAALEFRGGIEPDDAVELITDHDARTDELRVWLTVGGDVRASAVVQLAPTGPGEVSRASA